MTSASMGRYSEIGITTIRGFTDIISTVAGTTVTIIDSEGYLVDSLYDDGVLVVTSGTDQDKIFEISTVNASSNQIVTVGTVTGVLNDTVAILPKPKVYLCLQTESLKETINWDDTECLQTWEGTHHTPLTVDTGGDLGIFIGEESQALDMFLAAAMGTTTASAGLNGNSLHTYTPGDTIHGLTVFIMRGNHVSLTCYAGMSIETLVLDQPAGGMSVARATLAGGFGIQEIGGAGKTFPTGTGEFWDPPASPPDPKRMHFRHLIISRTTATAKNYTFAESGSITIARNMALDRRLGDFYTYDPQSSKFVVTGQFVQWFENDQEYTEWRGGHTKVDANPTFIDLRYKWTGTQTTGTYLQVDAYDTQFRDSTEPITDGRIKQTLTWQARYDTGEAKSLQIVYENNTISA